jgi:hypothetical protein
MLAEMEQSDSSVMRCELSELALVDLFNEVYLEEFEMSAVLTEADADWAQALFGGSRFTDDGDTYPPVIGPVVASASSTSVSDVSTSLQLASMAILVYVLSMYQHRALERVIELSHAAGIPTDALAGLVLQHLIRAAVPEKQRAIFNELPANFISNPIFVNAALSMFMEGQHWGVLWELSAAFDRRQTKSALEGWKQSLLALELPAWERFEPMLTCSCSVCQCINAFLDSSAVHLDLSDLDAENYHTQQVIRRLASQPWIVLHGDRRLYKPYSTEKLKTTKTACKDDYHPLALLKKLQAEYKPVLEVSLDLLT